MREGRQPGGCSLHKAYLPQALPATCTVAVAALPTGFHFVLQITGCIRTELSSSWADSPSSLKRFSGLPTAYPTPSALQTTSACWPASGWKSPPHDGAPRGRELLFQKSSLDQRLWKYPMLLET